MAQVDPVILELIARNDRYIAELRNTTRIADQQFGAQERRVKKLEAEMRASSSRIALSLKGLAGTLATFFTGRELVGLIDGFTRLQNELRVAGLEGSALEGVQTRLFEIANRNGVAINSLAELYGKSASAARDFGASQDQMLQLTEASALALRVSGTNAQAASGALLGLSQALASGTVRAEEFNQMNEGGLRPLLQAAAASEQFGGSIGKLRNAVVEGELSSRQFFDLILQGTGQLQSKADKAVLTLSGSFEVLRNKLIEFVGGAASANGVTAALSQGIVLLAENIDELATVLAVIVTALGIRYVAGVGAAVLANVSLAASATGAARGMGVMGASAFALQAYMAGAATATEAAKFAMVGLTAVLPILAIGALAAGIVYLTTETARHNAESARLAEISERNAEAFLGQARAANAATRETAGLSDAQIVARSAALGLSIDTDKLADAHYRAAAAARVQAIEEQKLATGAAAREVNRKAAETRFGAYAPIADTFGSVFGRNDPTFTGEQAQAFRNSPEYRAYVTARDTLQAMRDAPLERFAPSSGGGAGVSADADDKKKTSRTPRPSGPTEEQLARQDARSAEELSRLRQEELQARFDLAQSAEERAEIANELLAEERAVRISGMNADLDARAKEIKDAETLSAAQKQVRLDAIEAERAASLEYLERLYGPQAADEGDITVRPPSLYQQRVDFERRRQLEQEAQDLADEQNRAAVDALHLQYDLAQTEAERRRIALQILEAEDAALRSKLEAVRDSQVASAAEKERARIALEALNAQAGLRRDVVEQQHQGAFDRYLDRTSDPAAAAEEAAVRELQAVRDGLVEGLTDNLGIKNQFVKDMLTIFLDQVLFRPIAEAFRNQAGGGGLGGLIASLLGTVASAVGGGVSKSAGTVGTGSLKGFASGGSMLIGGIGGTDNNVLSLNGAPFARVSRGERLDIVPNRMAARAGGMQGPQFALSFHNDFRGAAPEAVGALSARIDRLQRELPGTIVTTMQDARSRFIWRDR
jgi:tape measure domain-containing protein